jgi:hypothetical protein
MSAATKRLLFVQLVGNALLLLLGYQWLGLGESTRSRLAMSALEAVAILALACWLHGTTFAHFRDVPRPALQTLRHLAPLLTAAIAVLALYGVLAWAASAAAQPALPLASWLTLHVRKPIKPATVLRIFQALFWIVRWVVLPVLLLPLASAIAARGWRGAAEFSFRRTWRYSVTVPVLLLTGVQLPFVLLHWVPRLDAFAMQFVSFTLRIGLGYVLFVGACVVLAFVTSRMSQILLAPLKNRHAD